MRTIKYLALIVVLTLAISVVAASYSMALIQPNPASQTFNGEKPTVKIVEATVVSINNSTVTATIEGETLDLFARGPWLIVTGELVEKAWWKKAKDYVKEGEALIAMSTVTRENKTFNVLLGLKQDDIILVKPILLRCEAKRHLHTNRYLSVKGEIVDKGNNYLLIERNESKGLVIIGSKSKWIKAGSGEVTWEEVANEFKAGDTIRIFCHHILVMKKEFAEAFGINTFIWGYSGAIINLTSGITISKA